MIVTRFHDVEELRFSVEFLSPTFLGGADQNAELRSAPFKNLFRQWWRVAQGNMDVNALRVQEGELFGTVLGEDKASASKVRLSIFPGEGFQVKESMPSIGKLKHPEVKKPNGELIPLDRLVYLGYGPVDQRHGQLVFRRFIKPGSKALLHLYCPNQKTHDVLLSVSLAHHFGTIGGRSRNGYGSIELCGPGIQPLTQVAVKAEKFDDIMSKSDKKYPNAFGKDELGFLCWDYVDNANTWEKTFLTFSDIYMRLRTSFPFEKRNVLEPRHILGYPAGRNHQVGEWGGAGGRMPSQLRLMVKRDYNGQVIGRILHLPHPVPKRWNSSVGQEAKLWKKVHNFLDSRKELKRFGGAQ